MTGTVRRCLTLVILLCVFVTLRGCLHHTQTKRVQRELVAPTPSVAVTSTNLSAAPTAAERLATGAPEQVSTCVAAIAAQSDPARLATLGSRQTNPRLKRIMYFLAQARMGGANPGDVIDQAQRASVRADCS